MPCWLGYSPVQNDARAGLQTGHGVYAFLKSVPSAAKLSSANVRISGVPKTFPAQGPWSSVRKMMISGLMFCDTLSFFTELVQALRQTWLFLIEGGYLQQAQGHQNHISAYVNDMDIPCQDEAWLPVRMRGNVKNLPLPW